MAFIELRQEVGVETAGRLDRVVQALTNRSRAEVRGLIDRECVRLNGRMCTEPGADAHAGDVVEVRYDPHVRYHARPRLRENSSFRLVFEDNDLIVVDKAAALLTVPTDRGETNTLSDAVERHLARKGRGRPVVVHRLDRGTSGLLVFGKNGRVGNELQNQFRNHSAEREYAAIVAGDLSRSEGTFASRLATSKSLQRYSVRPEEEGEDAVTHYRVQQRLPGATLVRVWLETGRRNQIRVHFAEAGHPVLGDLRYRTDLAQQAGWQARRLALHAGILGFEHPRTGERLRFESPIPEEFTRFLARQAKRNR